MKNTKNKAWRQARHKARVTAMDQNPEKQVCPEKNWKLMYQRSQKLHRARQLGMDYPKRTLRQILDNEMPIEDV